MELHKHFSHDEEWAFNRGWEMFVYYWQSERKMPTETIVTTDKHFIFCPNKETFLQVLNHWTLSGQRHKDLGNKIRWTYSEVPF